jgi:hypothetical protein
MKLVKILKFTTIPNNELHNQLNLKNEETMENLLSVCIQNSMQIEGMTERDALNLMGVFLLHAARYNEKAKGVIEFGTYKGRVSSLLGQLKKEKDDLFLIDTKKYLEEDKLSALGIDYNFHIGKSEEWNISSSYSGDFWYSHHDASHYFSNVSHELEVLYPKTSKYAVIVLDDFGDPYNQVRAAYYYQRYVKNNPFELLLIGFNKGILVRTEVFHEYEEYVLSSLQRELIQLGQDTTLFRTDVCKESRAFSIRTKQKKTDPDRYGLHIWGDRFYKLSEV